jgi:phage I-like protein
MADPDRVEKELKAMPAIAPGRDVTPGNPPKDGVISLNAAQVEVADMLGIPHDKYLETLKAEKEAR